jgi:glycosyltransferase involved in cell wall biosynthesis
MDLYAGWVHHALEASDGGSNYQLLRPSTNMNHGPTALKLAALRDRYVTLPRAIRSNQADIVHVLDQAYAHLIPISSPARVVVSCHDLIPLESERWGNGQRKALAPGWHLYRRSINHLIDASAVVVATNATKRRLISLLGEREDKVWVIPFGIEQAFHRARWRRPPALLRILHVGSNAAYKRVELVVDTAVLLAARGHRIELVKAGPRLPATLAARVIAAGITLIQHEQASNGTLRTSTEQAAIYSESTLLLFPSSREGFGLPVAEAMAVGLPVVAADIEPLLEVSGGYAKHVAADSTTLATAIERLVGEPGALERMSEDGRTWASRYNWTSYASALREVYAAVMTSGA